MSHLLKQFVMSPGNMTPTDPGTNCRGSSVNEFPRVSIHWPCGSVTLLQAPSQQLWTQMCHFIHLHLNKMNKCSFQLPDKETMTSKHAIRPSTHTGWRTKWYSLLTIKQQCYGWSFCHIGECGDDMCHQVVTNTGVHVSEGEQQDVNHIECVIHTA